MRSVVVETNQENILDVDRRQAMSIMLEKIRSLIANRRKDIENSLVSTGSPKSVRDLGYQEFNAAVMNRLQEQSPAGDEFRDDITKMIVVYHGKEIVADGFFKVGIGGTNLMFTQEQLDAMASMQEEGAATGKTETADGGVTETRQSQDVGEILSGSASVLHEIGGIIGLFTGGQPQTGNNNALNTGTPGGSTYTPPPRKTPWAAIIIGLVVIGAIVGAIIYFKKKKK